MAITPLSKHNNHQVTVHLCKPMSKHYAALRCQKCNLHIQWLSKQQTQQLQELGVPA
jgi:hypothetical protein